LLPRSEKTVIVTDGDMVAEGLAIYLTHHGKNIPNQVGILGFDNLNASGYFKIPLTTIEVPVKEMINNIIRLLKNEDHHTGPMAFISDSRIVYRESIIFEE
jgi:DNA-binding LacI/PurR family transcriptional regulator